MTLHTRQGFCLCHHPLSRRTGGCQPLPDPCSAHTCAAALPAAAGTAATAAQAAPARAVLPSPSADQLRASSPSLPATSSSRKPHWAAVFAQLTAACFLNYAKRTRFISIPSIFQMLKFKLLYVWRVQKVTYIAWEASPTIESTISMIKP